MRAITPETIKPSRVTALWFGVQLIWGAVLGISLQARCVQLAPVSPLVLFGAVAASGAFAAALTQLVAGPWSDRLRRAGSDRAPFYATGSLVGIAAVIVFYAATSAPSLLGAFVLLQIALNVVIGPYQAVIPDTMDPRRYGLASAWLAALASAGNAAGAIAATVFADTRILAIVLVAGLAGSAAITLTYLRRIKLQPLAAGVPFALSGVLIDLFISRAFVYLGFYTVLGYLYFYVASILPHGFALGATRASGICVLTFTLLGTVGALVAARPADRSDERLVVSFGGGLVAVSLVVLALTHGIAALPWTIAAAGVGWGIFLCADWAFACRLLPPSALATTMALWNLAVVGPQMLAPLVASVLLTRVGSLGTAAGPRDAMLLAGAEMLIGTVWIWRLPFVKTGK